jgi:hypothetical protein
MLLIVSAHTYHYMCVHYVAGLNILELVSSKLGIRLPTNKDKDKNLLSESKYVNQISFIKIQSSIHLILTIKKTQNNNLLIHYNAIIYQNDFNLPISNH